MVDVACFKETLILARTLSSQDEYKKSSAIVIISFFPYKLLACHSKLKI